MAKNPKFLQRLAFCSRGGLLARPSIVQYHPSLKTPPKHPTGYVVAFIEPHAVEHGPSLAAGPEALDLLDRLVAHFAPVYLDLTPTSAQLVDEARALLKRATPPAGAVNPNGTPRSL